MRRTARLVPLLTLTLLMAAFVASAAAVDRQFYKTEPSAVAPRLIVLDFLAQHSAELGVARQDLGDLAIVREYPTRHNGVTHFTLRQTVGGIEVDGTEISVAVDRQGRVFHPVGRPLADLAARAAASIRSPRLGPDEAVNAAAEALGTPRVDGLDLVEFDRAAVDQLTVFANPAVSEELIPVRLRYVRLADDTIRLAWNLSLKAPGDSNWWNAWIDADSGALLRRDNWTNDLNIDTYSVFASPKESPLNGGRTSEVDPWQAGGTTLPDGASPFGWHDTNGVLGEDFTDSRGNNVEAQTDLNANNTFGAPDIRASGGALPDLDFLPPFDPNLQPSGYLEAAVVNLFYWNNIVHDVTYQYGFDEASANFQVNNYGRGGVGGDPVQADAQDGSGTNNANFSTPGDGTDPRMQMYVWTAPQNIHENSPTVADFPAGARGAGWGGSPTFSVTNDLVFVNDGVGPDVNDGCERPTSWGVAGKIALVRRGNCEFGLKGLNGQLELAVGVILINNGSNGVAGMGPGASGASVTIPVQMIGKANGNGIVAEIVSNPPVNVTMSSTSSLPNRDSDLDNGVIAHEYGHGISNRLTGIGCLSGDEQMGEGWSDWMTLFLHAAPSDVDVTERSVGGYVSFEPTDTPGFIGIRTAPYTTDMTLNPQTYATLSAVPPPSIPHGVGAVWAQMLWEVYWNLVHLEGYDPDIYSGTGGNNVAFQLVMDGMKLQICAPGFVDGRNAILAADVADYESNHTCEVWRGFAKRGLGFSALQGSSASIADGTPAFDLPAACVDQIFSDNFAHGTTSHWDVVVP